MAVPTAAELAGLLRITPRYDQVLKKLKILFFDKGKFKAELTVDEEHLNPMGGLHGGLSATLVDSLSAFAAFSHRGKPGVSVDMHISYLKGALKGDTLEIDANTIKTGKTLGFVDVLIRNKKTGDLLIKASQTCCFPQ